MMRMLIAVMRLPSIAGRRQPQRLGRPPLLLRLPKRLAQRFEYRCHALWATERRGNFFVDDDSLE